MKKDELKGVSYPKKSILCQIDKHPFKLSQGLKIEGLQLNFRFAAALVR